MLDQIARRIETEDDGRAARPAVFATEKMKVLNAAVVLSNQLPHSKIVTFTRHGFMARGLAALRPAHAAILAFTPHAELFRQLRMLRAVEPFLMPFSGEPDLTIDNALAMLKRLGRVRVGDKLIIATDILAQDRLVDSVQLRTIR
jgi:pyruvate kinase